MIKDIDKFHSTFRGRITIGVIEILLAYLIVSRAIDTGSVFQWIIGIILLIGGLSNFIRAFSRGNVKTKTSKS